MGDMRHLGIDYGSKRVGVALSDEAEKFAMPLSVILNTPELVREVEKIAADNQVKDIVIGESRRYDMTANKILPEILEFKDELDKKGYSTYLELEFMTSQQAEREQGRHDMIDASAAALILQSYLDRKGRENR